MQQLARLSDKGTSYSDSQVSSFLITQTNQERWFFDQLDAGLNFKADLTPFVDYEHNIPKITHDSTAAIQRNLTLTVRGDSPLNEENFLSDIIRVRYQLKTPDGGWIEWVLGHFTLTPFDQDIFPGWTWHTIRSPDFGQLLVDSTFSDSYGVLIGTNYIAAIQAIVTSYGGLSPININITPTSLTIPAVLSWEAGISRLQAINDLLTAINYFPAWFDEAGTLTSSPIPDYSTALPSFIFDTTNDLSITMIPIQEKPDISKAFNITTVLVEDSRRPTFKGSYINDNPNDPISTVNWHPKSQTIRDSKIVDIATANARARSEGQKASRIFGKKNFSTSPWALSQNRDVYGLTFESTDEGLRSDLYVEMKWDMTCMVGKSTVHYFEKIVQ